MKRGAGLLLSNFDLQLASIANVASVNLSDHVTDFQTGFRSRRAWLNLRYYRANGLAHVEELRVLRRHISNADAHVSMRDLAGADQRIDRRAHDLRGYSESHSRKGTGGRDQEGVDTHHFSVCVHQRPTGIPRIDGSVGLNEFAGLAGIVRIGIWTIQRTHDSSRDGEAEPIRIAECQD